MQVNSKSNFNLTVLTLLSDTSYESESTSSERTILSSVLVFIVLPWKRKLRTSMEGIESVFSSVYKVTM